jgi:tetratricopeptide (TPR) repeat protein
MAILAPPDSHHYRAAEGWLEFGLPQEAAAEWSQLTPEARRLPLAVDLRWQISAALLDWDHGVQLGEQLVALAPESAGGWLRLSFALRRSKGGGLQRAWEALRPAADQFPEEETVAYNLACYATQLGRLDEGWEWFLRALVITSNSAGLRRLGLSDSDLEPLWDRIRGLR